MLSCSFNVWGWGSRFWDGRTPAGCDMAVITGPSLALYCSCCCLLFVSCALGLGPCVEAGPCINSYRMNLSPCEAICVHVCFIQSGLNFIPVIPVGIPGVTLNSVNVLSPTRNACSNRIQLLERVFIYVCFSFLAPRSLSVLLATAW